MALIHAYAGEAMLLRWSETPKGRTVTFLLDPLVNDQHPFKNMKCGESHGQRMQLAAVLIGDDERPVPPPKNGPDSSSVSRAGASPGSVEAAPMRDVAKGEDKPRTYTRSQIAALKIRDPEFQKWMCCFPYPGCTGDDVLRATDHEFKRRLGIQSKKELDPEGPKARAFEALLTDFSLRNTVRA